MRTGLEVAQTIHAIAVGDCLDGIHDSVGWLVYLPDEKADATELARMEATDSIAVYGDAFNAAEHDAALPHLIELFECDIAGVALCMSIARMGEKLRAPSGEAE